MNDFYDGTKLMSHKDINGKQPEIIICTSNRNAGKTTFFNRFCVKKFLKLGEKFCIIVRYAYETSDAANKFFKEIGSLFFPNYRMTSRARSNGIYTELFLHEKNDTNKNGIPCGYCVAINNSDNIKKVSHLLADTKRMIFDEFQSEQNKYCPNEVNKFISVHMSIARGGGEQVKFLPVYMISNHVTILNPYYTALGISARLQTNTTFLHGDGWVLEQGFNESASDANKLSAFNRAFANNSYVNYATELTYLNDNTSFVEKMKGKARYLFTLRHNNKNFGVRLYDDKGIVYINESPDITGGKFYACTIDDMTQDTILVTPMNPFVDILRSYFNYGALRFSSIECKDAVFLMISY